MMRDWGAASRIQGEVRRGPSVVVVGHVKLHPIYHAAELDAFKLVARWRSPDAYFFVFVFFVTAVHYSYISQTSHV